MRLASLCALLLVAACGGQPAVGLAAATPSGGPRVLFDLSARPMPNIPFPNDLAAFPDPGSPTGLRVNASLVAPTALERQLRGRLDSLDGWGTLSPITVAFDAPLDYQKLAAAMTDGDPTNDPVYLVSLEDGSTAKLDFSANFAVTLGAPWRYFPNDPHAADSNLLFPTTGPNANFLHDADPHWADTHTADQQYDDVATFYERATNTLILRPLRPLKQQTRYAVVLTDRLTDPSGRAVDSPFPGINHAAQTDELSPLTKLMPAGVDLAHVRFAWCFTTQSTTRDLEAIRAGLYGGGTLAWLADAAPVTVDQQGRAKAAMKLLPEVDDAPGVKNAYVLKADKFVKVLAQLVPQLIGCDGGGSCQDQIDAQLDTYKFIDYFVMGSYQSPDFMADGLPQHAVFELDRLLGTVSGQKTIPTSTVYFWMSVPKATATHPAPFPVAIYGHGYKGGRYEGIVGFSGALARYGIAEVSIDAFGHGLDLPEVEKLLVKAVLEQQGFGATADALFKGRLRDLDNDGVGDPGGDFWTADSFHTRDVIRQTEVDWMQLIRLLKTFDGKTVMDSVDGKAATSLAGDFNGDGVVDVGGPNADFFIWGESLGGILSAVLPAVEPSISAAAPVAAAGGLSDVGLRSTLGAVIDAVLLEVLGPMVSSCQWDAQTGACTGGEPHDALVWVVQQVSDEAHVLIARAPHVTFKAGDLVKVENLASGKVKTALVDSAGHVRVPIAADGPEYPIDYSKDPEHKLGKWDLTPGHFKDGDAMRITLCAANSDGTACAAGATPQVVTTYQDLAQSYHDDATGKDVALPVRFIGRPYPVGSPLVSPARGFGLERETPEFRRFWNLAEMTLEPGDPATYAPHWFEDLLPARANRPANVLLVLGAGDPIVPTSAGLNLARAGGLLDFEHLDPVYGSTDNDVLLAGHVMEGIARLKRFAPDAAGYAGTAPKHAHVACDALSGCAGETLLDVTGYSCDAQGANCADGFGTPRLTPPLKAQLEHDTCAGGRKGAGFTNCGTSALLLPMLNPHGQHGFTIPNPNAGFDYDTFLANKIFHFFETRGEDLVDDKCLAAEVNLEKSKVTPACAFMPQPPQP